MSANLLDGITPTLVSGTTEEGGVFHHAARTVADGHEDWLEWDLPGQSALATNQTYHVGLSTRCASANTTSLRPTIGYEDAAGHKNWAVPAPVNIGTSWGRAEATIVIPSGMTPFAFYVTAYGTCPETWMTAPTLSYGSPVTLAASAHTPYATQDHLAAEYATKAALRVTSDAVTAEVEERGKLAGKVDTLESTSGTHTSKLQQLAASITSLVKGESTYTDPDGKSATSGIYSLVTQTRDSVTALFASYTKTADLASTAAVQNAKKAGTDAASAASAAASAASAAQSTADAAKSTADELATMVRADTDGVTVGKSADGETWSTGRTRMTADAFEVLDKAGKVLSSFGKDKVRLGVDGAQIDMAGGRLLIDAQDHAASEMPSGLPTTITRMICPSSNSGKSDTEMYLGAYDKDSGNVVGGMGITVTRETDGSYNTSVGISGSLSLGSATIATPLPVSSGGTGATSIDAARRNLHISQGSKVCHGHGTPWVTLFESWSEFQQATGCYDSGLPTLVTMNGDMGAFDGTLSGCEIKAGDAVYVMAETTSGLPNISSTQSLRINWICIW